MSESTPAPVQEPVNVSVAESVQPTPTPVEPVAPPQAPVTEDTSVLATPEGKAAAEFGRVDDEGKVWLRTAEGEREVGQYAASGGKEAALALYVRRYLDVVTQVKLLESRLEKISPEESRKALKAISKDMEEPAAVGDLDALRTRIDHVAKKLEEHAAVVAERRAQAKAEALAYRTQLVERAEEIANTDPSRVHWRNSREEFAQLFEAWKQAQRGRARIDRPTEEALWQRFSRARTSHDKARRQHFAQLDARRAEVSAAKEKLITRAQELSTSTEWTETANKYHALLEEWKKAGRANRRDDDALWKRFMEARQPFYDARSAHFSEVDAEKSENLKAKLALVKEAEKVLPVKDIDVARETLREIGERWDAIGAVPRDAYAKTEGRMREIENKVRVAQSDQWNRTDPEKQQRSSGMAAQLEALIAQLDEEIAQAEATGNTKELENLQEARKARVAWLEQVNKDL
ncbi:DUF349 domain-containing protein [Actinotignum urinale]|uniref:DUF349 domain-containing protein n=1 Tax=Actinotignum urinale TaxID=190146 RepID=UPI00370DD4BF